MGCHTKRHFYTSLKDLAHPNSDFSSVKAIIDGSMENWQDRFVDNAKQTLLKLKDEHAQFLSDEIEERKNTFAEIVSEDEWTKQAELKEEAAESKKC